MNRNILDTEVQLFINENLKTDINKLILKGSYFPNITIQELANQIIAKQKSEKKLPTWFCQENIYYPAKLSIEQTSSETTAAYKATLVSGNSLIDITGGFGVDTYYFSNYFSEVTHCEINLELSEIVSYNYSILKNNNITTVIGDGLDFLRTTDAHFDCIYIDPSRRNESKGKVFLLKDCLPNIPENLDFLFTKSNVIFIKNSPILDISSAINELNYVKEIHIVAVKNEVKELLFLLEKGYTKPTNIHTCNLLSDSKEIFSFNLSDTPAVTYSAPLTYLYEPNAAVLKSGGFNHVSEAYNVFKLHQHSHLYTSNSEIINFPGRCFSITKIIKYHKKNLKKEINYGKANITTRNFPKSVEQLRKETKLKDGGDVYLFFTTDFSNELIVIECKKLS